MELGILVVSYLAGNVDGLAYVVGNVRRADVRNRRLLLLLLLLRLHGERLYCPSSRKLADFFFDFLFRFSRAFFGE